MVHKMQAEKPAVQAVTPAPLDGRDTLQERDLPPQEPEGASKAQSTGLSTVFTKFAGMCISDLLFIEVFAGTARLSRIARETGFQVLPIDKTNARAPQMFIAQYDLADDNAVQSLLDLLETERDKIVAVHLAPACGTASKAREKQLSSLAKQGFKIPGPLRSKEKPMGLDSLEGLDKVRTETANLVYAATALIVKKCILLDLLCSIENPENSLFWHFPDIAQILETADGHSVSFHNCMHGGRRNKLTKWWATKDVYGSLHVLCDNSHEHAKWNPTPVGGNLKFPTADEAAYPLLLCKRVLALILDYAIKLGAQNPDTLKKQLPSGSTTSHRWILDMLPKGKKLKPLVSEFQSYKQFLNGPDQDPETAEFFAQLPKGSRFVQRHMQWGRVRVCEQASHKVFMWHSEGKQWEVEKGSALLERAGGEEQFLAEVCTVGIPREPWDFLEKAVEAGHPRTLAVHLNSEVTQVLRENFEGEPHLLVKQRAAFLVKWTNRCKELEKGEAELHATLQPHLQSVLHGKRLLVFQEMLDSLGYPDTALVRDICEGFRLTGWLTKSQVFPLATKRPSHSVEAAKQFAKGVNHSIVKQASTSVDEELAAEVWNQTEDEVSKGWAWLDSQCDPSTKLLAKRFGLKQGEKVRLIDDCTVGGFNGACGVSERLRVHAVDEMAAYIAWCLTNLSESSMREVVGKTYDLRNAYKQYGIHPSDRDLLRLAVWNPHLGRVQFLGANALPFGAIGSVSAFLRVAMAVWYIGIRGLRLCWTSFFDDYTMLSKRLTSRSAALAAESLFCLLGIDFARDGRKAVEWGTRVKTLGVVLDLKPDCGAEPYVELGHTESRVSELSTFLGQFLTAGSMSQKDAERLRGRLQWFESFAHGRIAQQALRTVSGIAAFGRVQTRLTEREISALRFLKDRVLTAPPTRIQATNLSTWICFSDGACEGEQEKLGTIGAVLVNPVGVIHRYFSEKVPFLWRTRVTRSSSWNCCQFGVHSAYGRIGCSEVNVFSTLTMKGRRLQ